MSKAIGKKTDARITAADILTFFLGGLPLLSLLEVILRGPAQVYIFKDFASEALILFCSFPLELLFISTHHFGPSSPFMTLLYLLLIPLIIWSLWKSGKLSLKMRITILRNDAIRLVLGLAGLSICAFWFFLTAWQPVPMAVAGGLVVAGQVFAIKKQIAVRRYLWVVLGLLAIVAFFFVNALSFFSAKPVTSFRLFNRPSYDARITEKEKIILSREDEAALSLTEKKTWKPIENKFSPQRYVIDDLTGDMYITNFQDAFGNHAVTILNRDLGVSSISLPKCWKAIDAAIDSERRLLYVLCEFSGNIFVWNLDRQEQVKVIDVPLLPYHIELDPKRQRFYVMTHTVSGSIFRYDERTNTSLRRLRGFGQLGGVFDEDSRTLWVACTLQGEVLVFDESLRLIERIKVGCAPRELALDRERGVVLAANYLDGTVSVIDLKTRRLVDTIRFGPYDPVPLLRGISLSGQGKWIASWRGGVSEIDPGLFH